MVKSEKSRAGWYFLFIVFGIYVLTAIIKPEAVGPSLWMFADIIKKIAFVFILVFLILLFFNYLVSPKKLVKWMEKGKGVGGFLISSVGGILSSGPIYMWYPLMNEMKKHGVKERYLAVFLYNRAIKPALLPFLVYYFGFVYTLVLTVVMFFMSIIQGYLVEKIVRYRKLKIFGTSSSKIQRWKK